MQEPLARNIPIAYATAALGWGRFFVPVLALFYIASHVTLAEFTIIMAVFSFVILALEIPSGAISDHLGPRKTLLIGRSLYLIEILLLAFTNGFWPLLLAKTISGVGVSLNSGTDSGMLYETLKALGREDEHKRIVGIKNTIMLVSMGVIFIIGGWLFTVSPKLTAICSIPFVLANIAVTARITDPPTERPTAWRLWNHISSSLRIAWKHPHIRFLVLFSSVAAGTILTTYTISSAYLEHILLPVALIGLVTFVGQLFGAFIARITDFTEARLGERKSISALAIALGAALLLMAFTNLWLGVLGFILLYGAHGFYRVVTDNYMNTHAESTRRVTILSVQNMGVNIVMTALLPVAGTLMMGGTYGYGFSWLTAGYTVLMLVLVVGTFPQTQPSSA